MKLLSLKVENFRNLSKIDLSLGSSANVFVGANAQGKTNIMEAISILAFGKSLRGNSEKNLLKNGKDFFRVGGVAENSKKQKIKIEIAANTTTKTLKLNGKKINASDLLGNLPVVIFIPEDLNLLLLSPNLRRRHLDILLSQISQKYLRALSSYLNALKNRNALLTRIVENLTTIEELDFWDWELAKNGSVIGKTRAEFLEFAENPLAENFSKISNEEKKLSAKVTNFHGEQITPEKYLENLQKMRERDLRFGNTNYGIHRADFLFKIEDKSLIENGSRGEVRSAILALKFTELDFLEKHLKKKPLLLLDDVFSELDISRQKNLMQLIQNYQTFLTTTKLNHLDLIENKEVWEIKNGDAKKF